MTQTTVPLWLQATLIVVLTATFPGFATLAQEMPRAACPPYGNICAGGFDDRSLRLAQLDERPESGGQREGRGARFDHGRMGSQRKFGKHIEQFRLLKLLELLDLKDDQEVDFITVFHSMRRQRHQLHEKKMALIDELADGLRNGTASDSEINRLIREIAKSDDQQEQVTADFLSEAQRILTPSQLGRFIVFRERFEFELLEAVKAFRERQPPPGDSLPPEELEP